MRSRTISTPEFNEYAADYEQLLAEGLAVSGEDKDYFAQGRIDWVKTCMDQLGVAPQFIMDFGCGTGSSVRLLHQRFAAKSVLGVDPSIRLIERAERQFGSANRFFKQSEEYSPCEEIDLVYCNGVFHHIQVANRAQAAEYVWRALKPGGYWAFWENNPWNPGTRYVMSRIPFDRDAVTLSAPDASILLQSAGFHMVKTDYLFVFPKYLRVLRWMEPHLTKLPAGAQYLVLARKSGRLREHA